MFDLTDQSIQLAEYSIQFRDSRMFCLLPNADPTKLVPSQQFAWQVAFATIDPQRHGSEKKIPSGVLPNSLLILALPVAVYNRKASILSESPLSDLDPGRGLAAFVFVAVHRGNDLPHHLGVKPLTNHILVA